MSGFTVDFLGCKISQTDAETIREALADAGHGERELAGVRVVNTCCITSEAEKKSRKVVRQLLREGDDVHVFVTGCAAALRTDDLLASEPRVTVLPGPAPLVAGRIVDAVDAMAGLACRGNDAAPQPLVRRRARAFVKVQDGCSFLCSYCIVPTVRGASRSRRAQDVLADVRRRVEAGQREIVLTGVNIGLFGDPDLRGGLAALVERVADTPGVARVRISSIEVNHVNRRLLEVVAGHPRVCPHLHIPLQSGDDGVLAAMRRNYDSARYRRALERARKAIDSLNLTTDVIVGFPGETDEAFARTLELARDAGFTKVHAFPFSPRPGTDAATAAAPVSASVKRQRSEQLRREADERGRAHRARLVGQVDEVVVERGDSEGDAPHGYTMDYSPVRLVGAESAADGDLVTVRLEPGDEAALTGTVIDATPHS